MWQTECTAARPVATTSVASGAPANMMIDVTARYVTSGSTVARGFWRHSGPRVGVRAHTPRSVRDVPPLVLVTTRRHDSHVSLDIPLASSSSLPLLPALPTPSFDRTDAPRAVWRRLAEKFRLRGCCRVEIEIPRHNKIIMKPPNGVVFNSDRQRSSGGWWFGGGSGFTVVCYGMKSGGGEKAGGMTSNVLQNLRGEIGRRERASCGSGSW